MSAKKKKPKLRPSSAQTIPGDGRANSTILPLRQAGVRVNEDTAMTLGAVFACVRVISETLACFPWEVRERGPDGREECKWDDPLNWFLNFQASDEMAAFQWRETMVAHALTWGNGYAEIEREQYTGAVRNLWILTPERVRIYRENGRIIYHIQNPVGPPTDLYESDIFHLRGLGFDGLMGYSVIRLAARSIGLGISLEESAANFSANDSTPGGVLTTPNRLKPDSRQNLRESWSRVHGGPSRRRSVAILEEGLTWQQTSLPPEDGQLIEQRHFTPAEICRWFRVQPHKIADLTRSTNNNIEHQDTEFWRDTLAPWARRLEAEANLKLFGRNTRGRRFTRFNQNEILRGDAVSRASYLTQMVDHGIFSVNDALRVEGMNQIGPEGDVRHFPLNMQPLVDSGGESGEEADSDKLLDVPDVPQRESWDCGAAAASMVSDYWGTPLATYEDYISQLGTTQTDGTDPQQLVGFFMKRGLSVSAGQEMDFDDLAEFVRDGRPVICAVQDYGTPEAERTGRSGHYVVVVGVGLGQVIIRDPAFSKLVASTGDSSSSRRLVEQDEFLADWHDIGADGTPYIAWGLAIGDEVASPKPAPEPQPTPAKEPVPQPNQAEMRAMLGPIVEEACNRLGKNIQRRLSDQQKKNGDAIKWIEETTPELRRYAIETLTPVSMTICRSAGGDGAEFSFGLSPFVEAFLLSWKVDQGIFPNPNDLMERMLASVTAHKLVNGDAKNGR